MPNPEARELARLLVRKAEGDEAILHRLLDDHDVPDDVLGFHVQQAVEKRLKAVLALDEVEYERTHSVSYLVALIEQQGIDLPDCREEIEALTPWAVAARYDSTFEQVLDRAGARSLVAALQVWSARSIDAREKAAPQTDAEAADGQKTSEPSA